MAIKRSREDDEEVERIARANCLKLLSRVGYTSRLYHCKLCNRQFSSFQALGGHRASHKRLRASSPPSNTSDGSMIFSKIVLKSPSASGSPPPYKAKTHGCSICGAEFPIGQALGGHMRRHRNNVNVGPVSKKCGDERRDVWFDLNLTPRENYAELAKRPPILDCFLLT